jgi:predicted nucleic acid-binding protein
MDKRDILIDSSFFVAIGDLRDPRRLEALRFSTSDRSPRIVIDVVLTEVMYLLGSRIDRRAAIGFLQLITMSDIGLERVTKSDLVRVKAIMSQYEQFDFVDCCVMALAERLEVKRICTYDRRDFAAYRPTHCDYLELLP